MLKIGITGNIGSGKTTVSKLFELLGVPVFYADDEAKKVMVTDDILKDEIKLAFGKDAYFDNGTLNRKYLADIVFNDDHQLNRLNLLVHPATFRAFNNWAGCIIGAPYVLKEAALLFETDSYTICDYTILVRAPLEKRIERVIQRDGLKLDDIKSRESKQLPEEKKSSLADYIIINDDQHLVIPQVLKLHRSIIELSH
jgi:dephospho-CoA kinase